MNNWKKYKLGDFAEINPRVPLKQGNEYSFVEMKDLDAMLKYVSPSMKKELKGGSKFENRDTLFARITPCLENGKICQVKNLENNLGFGSTEFLIFRGKENISDTDFVYYLTKTDYVRNNAVQMMTGSSGRQRVEKSALEKLEIFAPDLTTQTQIAQILSSFDDKIECLTQMNQTLETMAQAIFKEWFVDFNFPKMSELGLGGLNDDRIKENNEKEILKSTNPKNHNSDNLPKGWRKGKLGDICYVQNGYAFKSNDLKDFGDDGIIKIKNISNRQVDTLNTQFVSKSVSEKIDLKFRIESGNILIAMTGAEVGKIGLVPKNDKNLWLNQRVGNFREKIEFAKWFIFLILVQDEYQSLLFSSASGSAQPNISATQIEGIELTIPSKEKIKEFGKLVNPFFEKILENSNQIRTLTQLRDSLLPKLMNGQMSEL